jgi:hypothetical protein
MPNPVILQAFDENNPPTVAQVNSYFATIAAAVNALAGEPVIEWSTAAPSSGVYAEIAGADFIGPISAPQITAGSPGANHAYQDIDAATDKTAALRFKMAGVLRWQWQRGTDTSFALARYDASGVYVDSPIIVAANGAVTILGYTLPWSSISGKPTTVAGYGIADMAAQSVAHASTADSATNATNATNASNAAGGSALETAINSKVVIGVNVVGGLMLASSNNNALGQGTDWSGGEFSPSLGSGTYRILTTQAMPLSGGAYAYLVLRLS